MKEYTGNTVKKTKEFKQNTNWNLTFDKTLQNKHQDNQNLAFHFKLCEFMKGYIDEIKPMESSTLILHMQERVFCKLQYSIRS